MVTGDEMGEEAGGRGTASGGRGDTCLPEGESGVAGRGRGVEGCL